MKRILSIDGGGIRGVFALKILRRIEQLYREERRQPDLVLANVFDMFAGTSTGAIVATCLCWGMPVERIEKLYVEQGAQMFTRASWYRRWIWNKYRSETLEKTFQDLFREDAPDAAPALLGSANLHAKLVVVMR